MVKARGSARILEQGRGPAAWTEKSFSRLEERVKGLKTGEKEHGKNGRAKTIKIVGKNTIMSCSSN